MSSSDESCYTPEKKYRGIRRRKWGKWVSEIRVPGTQERLWLGTYASPEGAAVAHDIAYYCLRQTTSADDFNFPLVLPNGVQKGMSPMSIQQAATDAGMAVDAKMLGKRCLTTTTTDNIESTSGQRRRINNDVFDQSWDQISRGGIEQSQMLNVSVEDYNFSDPQSCFQ